MGGTPTTLADGEQKEAESSGVGEKEIRLLKPPSSEPKTLALMVDSVRWPGVPSPHLL